MSESREREYLSVAELLARNGREFQASGGRRRRREDGGISVNELTGRIPRVVVEDDNSTLHAGLLSQASAPVVAEPPVTEPPVTEPPVTEPAASATAVTEPSVAKAAVPEPSAASEEPADSAVAAVVTTEPSKVDKPRTEKSKVDKPKPEQPKKAGLLGAVFGLIKGIADVVDQQQQAAKKAESASKQAPLVGGSVDAFAAAAKDDTVADEVKGDRDVAVEASSPPAIVEQSAPVAETKAPSAPEPAPPAESASEVAAVAVQSPSKPADIARTIEAAVDPQLITAAKPATVDAVDAVKSPSRVRQWIALIAQVLIGAVVGAALFIGFMKLWVFMPVMAFLLGVVVTLALVAAVLVLRRSYDLISIALAVVVGLLVTMGPLPILLQSR